MSRQFVIELDNRPGELAHIAKALAARGVDIRHISTSTSRDRPSSWSSTTSPARCRRRRQARRGRRKIYGRSSSAQAGSRRILGRRRGEGPRDLRITDQVGGTTEDGSRPARFLARSRPDPALDARRPHGGRWPRSVLDAGIRPGDAPRAARSDFSARSSRFGTPAWGVASVQDMRARVRLPRTWTTRPASCSRWCGPGCATPCSGPTPRGCACPATTARSAARRRSTSRT
jgi:hypothetical protein